MGDPHQPVDLPLCTDIRTVIDRRHREEEQQRRRNHHPVHLGLIALSFACAMLLWLWLAWASARYDGRPIHFWMAVAIGFAVIPAITCVQLSIAYKQRQAADQQHDDVLAGMQYLNDRITDLAAGHDATVGIDPAAAEAAQRIHLRLLGSQGGSRAF